MAAKDAIAWDNVCAYLGNAEGDLIVAMRRTLDILRQFQRAPHMPQKLAELCGQAEKLLDRGEVHEAIIWVNSCQD